MNTKGNALVWFTNNLRVGDNNALFEACSNHKKVVGLYCFDPKHFITTRFGFKKTGKYRAQFLIETVYDLYEQLEALNIPLIIRYEHPENCIPELCSEHAVSAIYKLHEWMFEETQTEQAVIDRLDSSIEIIKSSDQFLYHPDDIPLALTDIPEVFTDFRKYIEKDVMVRPIALPKRMPVGNNFKVARPTITPDTLGLPDFIPHPNSAFPFKGGENAALDRLHYYIFKSEKLKSYKTTRNGLIGIDYSTKFSPWLANGSLSPRTLYHRIKLFEKHVVKNQSTYWLIFELLWRDYFKYISLKHGNKIFHGNGISASNKQWDTDSNLVKAWIDGATSSDFVNANMKELKQTGWMSNRGRQNVASYFSKELNLDWRIGAAYFESLLIDYDVHSNYGNWLYVAGIGNDPRDRKFNVELQANRYDPSGTYRKLWL